MSLQTFFDNFALLAEAPNGVAKLRELILQLAVEGRLVSQDSRDEPASELLKRIKADKERLAKEKKINKEEAAQSIQEDEMPFAIPDNWQWVRLSQIANEVHYGYTASANHALTDVRLLRITDIQNGKVVWANVPGCEIDEKKLEGVKLENNDILIARTGGTIGKSYIVENLVLVAVFASYLIRAIPNKNLHARYLKTFLESELYWIQLYDKSMGTGQPNVNATSLKSLMVPLPPLEEQKRIVAKVDELMRLCNELEARQQARRSSQVRLNNATLAPLNNAASLAPEEFEQASARLADKFAALYDSAETVGRLRSTILQLAVQGKLAMQDSQDEPAVVLLERIEEEREANKEKQKKKRIDFPSLSLDDVPFTIPSKWLWTHLGQLAMLIEYGTSEKASLDNKGVPVFRMNNIEGGTVLHSNLKYVSPTIKDLPRLYLQYNELLFNRTNSIELVGKTGIFKGESDKFTFASYLIRIRVFDSHIFPDYINLAMNAAYFRETQINTEVTQQCGQANFNGTKLAYTLIPLPPLEEQKRIVAKVNQLMSLCDELEAKLRQTEEDSEKLMKAAAQHVLSSILCGIKISHNSAG